MNVTGQRDSGATIVAATASGATSAVPQGGRAGAAASSRGRAAAAASRQGRAAAASDGRALGGAARVSISACVFVGGLGAAVLLWPVAGIAGALEDCLQRTANRAEVTPCLQANRKAATDAMLEQFLAVERALADLEQATGRGGKTAQLKQSQRDFERYLHSQCQVVLRAGDGGSGAAQAQLACEVDMLRSRAETLRLLVAAREETKK